MLEAVVYITEEPLTLAQICRGSGAASGTHSDDCSTSWSRNARSREHGVTIREVAGGYKMATKPEHHEAVRQFRQEPEAAA